MGFCQTSHAQDWFEVDRDYSVVKVNPETLSIPSTEEEVLDFSIYPNPSNDSFQLTGINTAELAAIRIYNCIEDLVYEGNDLFINSSQFNNGIYFVTTYLNSGKQLTKKLIKG